jgi:hypothetical protein
MLRWRTRHIIAIIITNIATLTTRGLTASQRPCRAARQRSIRQLVDLARISTASRSACVPTSQLAGPWHGRHVLAPASAKDDTNFSILSDTRSPIAGRIL